MINGLNKNEITLPLHTLLSDEDVEYVCVSLKRAMDEVVIQFEENK